MIDLNTLAIQENCHLIMESTGFTAQGGAELRRLAMRYLALREMEVLAISAAIERGECEDIGEDCVREQIDAAADRRIQEMLK